MTDIIKKFVKTEGGLLVEIEGTCTGADVDCHMLCRDGFVDSGSFTIINACTLPITVTGFTVSDPERFSLVEYPKYTGSGVYPSGEVPELPIPFTLKPRGKKKIATFFHPKYEELMYGNAGTIISRTGDKFGATVQFYPGFPILNCTGKSDCDASVILSGEFICDDKEEDREWMDNCENYEEKEEMSLPVVQLSPCVPHTSEHTKAYNGSVADGFLKLSSICSEMYDGIIASSSWQDDKYLPWLGAIKAFELFLDGINSPTSYDQIYNESFAQQEIVLLSENLKKASGNITEIISNTEFKTNLPQKADDAYNGAKITFGVEEYTVSDYDGPAEKFTISSSFNSPQPENGDPFGIDLSDTSTTITRETSVFAEIKGEDGEYEFQGKKGVLVRISATSEIESVFLIQDARIYFEASSGQIKMFIAKNYNIDSGLCADDKYV
jgi:hypothetical protein